MEKKEEVEEDEEGLFDLVAASVHSSSDGSLSGP